MPPKIPKKLDLFPVMSDNSAFVIGERQLTFTPPYSGELRFTWKGAMRSVSKRFHVQIETWDIARMEVIEC